MMPSDLMTRMRIIQAANSKVVNPSMRGTSKMPKKLNPQDPADGRKERAQDEGIYFVPEQVDAHVLGHILVLSNSDQ